MDHHRSVAILEDEAFIALELEDMLRDAGFDIAGVFSSCVDALEWFRGSSPDIVVMDIGLADGDCVRIATLLDARNIPFVVHSASYANSGFHDPIFLQGTWVAMPASPSELRNAIHASLAMANGNGVSWSAKAR
ncbi:hypothetical protein X773_03410 [Mesorhizobium sp. LSJC285A00]|uniref:response regulator n=1 Tax=Mesorhizobium sp. LSJC285A00 TaxID=1287338 RepID=UPI0003CF57E8|nr:response regulator [Mesorhizobium sp. LSJC285A00]ESW89198.1 hypothetical protein X773_03410 [Mesorhizobium sp. LSJC285A00]